METLHLAFNRSAAGSIGDALDTLGVAATVIAPTDDLAMGWLRGEGESFAATRRRWWADALGFEPEPADLSEATFWTPARHAPHVTVWLSRRNAADVAAFARLMALRDERPTWVIDATDVLMADSEGRLRRWPLALLPARVIASAGLIGHARQITDEEGAQAKRLWKRIERENAALRVHVEGGVRSVAETYFDAELLTLIEVRPQRIARILGAFLDLVLEKEDAPSASDLFVLSRLEALAAQGMIEIEGKPTIRARCRLKR